MFVRFSSCASLVAGIGKKDNQKKARLCIMIFSFRQGNAGGEERGTKKSARQQRHIHISAYPGRGQFITTSRSRISCIVFLIFLFSVCSQA